MRRARRDDDEVALIHGPAETGFSTLSEPMVNIRATLAAAEADGVISPSTRETLELAAKALHFAQRAWPAVIAKARSFSSAEAQALQQWLPQGQVDRKRSESDGGDETPALAHKIAFFFLEGAQLARI